ncbi:MAG: lytic transglycosylase domain-containing protein [Ferruginibacter sp.]|nr:lytic transglycosylase domain-containing protein [Ferruginibacter sp.]
MRLPFRKMKAAIPISLLLFFLLLNVKKSFSVDEGSERYKHFADTLIKNDSLAKKIIEEIVINKKAPKKESVQYISSLTQYGFKDLFSTSQFNRKLSYQSQINPHAELYIKDYLQNQSKYLLRMKGWGKPYFNLIESIFRQYGLPSELKYLAVIESSLQTSCTSWVGAAGPWQFMPETGRDYGLIVNNQTDDRRDYNKSTHAAARLLIDLYSKLNDWLLVIAAYNGGIGRVYEAETKSGSKNFWELQYYLPEESRNHVKKFIATHYIMEDNSSGNFLSSKENLAIHSENANMILTGKKLSGKYNALVIAKNLNLDIAEFKKYNPHFDEDIAYSGETLLTLPNEKMELFNTNKYIILNESIQVILQEDNSRNDGPPRKNSKSRKSKH